MQMFGMPLSELKDIASIVAGGVAVISAAIALWAFLASRSNQKEALLQKAYYDYSKMALDHPELAFPPNSSNYNYKDQTLNGRIQEFERYEWFLSALLVTVHFVKKVRPRNKLWKTLTTNQLSYHWEYIDAFWDDKRFIQNWRTVLKKQLNDGVKQGKAKYKPKCKSKKIPAD